MICKERISQRGYDHIECSNKTIKGRKTVEEIKEQRQLYKSYEYDSFTPTTSINDINSHFECEWSKYVTLKIKTISG